MSGRQPKLTELQKAFNDNDKQTTSFNRHMMTIANEKSYFNRMHHDIMWFIGQPTKLSFKTWFAGQPMKPSVRAWFAGQLTKPSIRMWFSGQPEKN